MTIRPRVLSGLALGLLIASSSPATEDSKTEVSPGDTVYYVDGETGDDDNSGTSPQEAWKSLQRVNRMCFA